MALERCVMPFTVREEYSGSRAEAPATAPNPSSCNRSMADSSPRDGHVPEHPAEEALRIALILEYLHEGSPITGESQHFSTSNETFHFPCFSVPRTFSVPLNVLPTMQLPQAAIGMAIRSAVA